MYLYTLSIFILCVSVYFGICITLCICILCVSVYSVYLYTLCICILCVSVYSVCMYNSVYLHTLCIVYSMYLYTLCVCITLCICILCVCLATGYGDTSLVSRWCWLTPLVLPQCPQLGKIKIKKILKRKQIVFLYFLF